MRRISVQGVDTRFLFQRPRQKSAEHALNGTKSTINVVSIKVPINHDEKGDGDPEIGDHFGLFRGTTLGGILCRAYRRGRFMEDRR